MKGFSIATLLVAALLLALTPVASAIYREAYPTDQARRAALAACAHDDPGFNRLLAGERAQCYARSATPASKAPLPIRGRVATG